jgi:outer membrane protein assembly factor BamA
VDVEISMLKNEIGLQSDFATRLACMDYVNKLPAVLQSKGYVTASLDSVFFDTTNARLVLFLGRRYKWAKINTSSVDQEMLAASGWNEKSFTNKPMDLEKVNQVKEQIMRYLENNGYPFGKIYLDSLNLEEDSLSAILKIEKGPLYKIDSIRVFGNAKISNKFLQNYLDIHNGSVYKKEKLISISRKISELPYLEEEQPANLSLLGTGSVLNLYLKQKKSSQINLLIGFLPNSDQSSEKKLIITGEANIHLKNAFGGGESIGLNWQQLQLKSPRLNIFYQQPYFFNSPVSLDLSFDMLRKDSSYLNINMNLGARYSISEAQTGSLYLHNFQTIISEGGINEEQVIATHRLPEIADMNVVALGIDFEKNKTNYRYNPRNGYEFRVGGSVGSKKVKKNNQILELEDVNNPDFDFETLYDTVKLKSYQLKLNGTAAKYFPFGKQGTIKTGVQLGILQSENIYRNELFQIGGYKTLRGFDEESEYVSRYVIGTLEYRYLIGLNSYFFGFVDGGWSRNTSNDPAYSHTYIGTGLGLAFETKTGIFNLAWAVGKRNDLPFNFSQSKIHFGFVNYF